MVCFTFVLPFGRHHPSKSEGRYAIYNASHQLISRSSTPQPQITNTMGKRAPFLPQPFLAKIRHLSMVEVTGLTPGVCLMRGACIKGEILQQTLT